MEVAQHYTQQCTDSTVYTVQTAFHYINSSQYAYIYCQGMEWADYELLSKIWDAWTGWSGEDTPQTVMTTRALAVLKRMDCHDTLLDFAGRYGVQGQMILAWRATLPLQVSFEILNTLKDGDTLSLLVCC